MQKLVINLIKNAKNPIFHYSALRLCSHRPPDAVAHHLAGAVAAGEGLHEAGAGHPGVAGVVRTVVGPAGRAVAGHARGAGPAPRRAVRLPAAPDAGMAGAGRRRAQVDRRARGPVAGETRRAAAAGIGRRVGAGEAADAGEAGRRGAGVAVSVHRVCQPAVKWATLNSNSTRLKFFIAHVDPTRLKHYQ